MTYPAYIREKALELRTKKKLTIDEIAERLAISRTTIYYWVRDIPAPEITYRDSPGRARSRAKAARANKARFKSLRDSAYDQGWHEFEALCAEPTFRDFICMYIGEGYKRNRNRVSLANSDPAVIKLADDWIRRLTTNRVYYSFQHHADQDPTKLIAFWSAELGADPDLFRFQRKSNSGALNARSWRSAHGVLSVICDDTYLRARLQAWVDRVREGWLDS